MLTLKIVILVFVSGFIAAGITVWLRRTVLSKGLPREVAVAMSAARIVAVFAIAFPTGVAIHEQLSSFDKAEDASRLEAEAIAMLWRENSVKPPSPNLPELEHALICYLKYVIDVEWPAMASGNVSDISDARLWDLYRSVPHDNSMEHIRDFQTIGQIAGDRAVRIASSQEPLPPALWVFLCLGFLALMLTVFLEAVATPTWAHATAVGIVTGLSGLLVSILMVLNNPFSPPLSVHPVDLKQKLNALVKAVGDDGIATCRNKAKGL